METKEISERPYSTELEPLITYKKEEQCDFIRSLYYKRKTIKLKNILHKVVICKPKDLNNLKIEIQNELKRIQ